MVTSEDADREALIGQGEEGIEPRCHQQPRSLPRPCGSQSREGSAGRNATNGRVLTKPRAAVSERRSSQPMIHVARRNLHGCRRRNPATTAKLSSSERKRCCGVNDSRPIWTCSAGRTRMFRIQSVSWPQAEKMTASWVCESYFKTMAVAEWSLPVLRPAWTSSRKVWPRSRPHPRRYSGSGIRKTARARRPGLRRSPRSGLALRAAGGEATGPPTAITSEPARITTGSHAQRTLASVFTPEANVLCWPGEEATRHARRWPAARWGRAIRLSDGSGCLWPMPAAPGVPRPRLPRQSAHPAPPHRRLWSSHTSPQSYGRPSRRAKAAGLARDFGLARLRREVAAAAT